MQAVISRALKKAAAPVLPAQAAAPSAGEGVEALVAEVSVGGVETLVAEVSVGGVEAAAAALKRRAQMDQANKMRRKRTAAKAAAKAAAPSAGEGVDAGDKRKMDEPDPLPSKKQKEAAALAKKIDTWLADNGSRGRAKPAAPPRMRTCTRYLGRALAPTKIVMREGAGRNPPQRYGRRRVVRRGPLLAPAEAAPAMVLVDPALSMMMGFF
jgi:hypothetical protein